MHGKLFEVRHDLLSGLEVGREGECRLNASSPGLWQKPEPSRTGPEGDPTDRDLDGERLEALFPLAVPLLLRTWGSSVPDCGVP